MEAEYGSVGGVRFLNPSNVKMYDGDGNEVLCACGKPAGMAAMGKAAYKAWCSDCYPAYQPDAKFVYRPPTEEQKEKFKKMGFILPEES